MTKDAQRTVWEVGGTRPGGLNLVPGGRALAATPGIRVRTCVTAQHRGLLDQVLDIAGLTPDVDLDLMEPGQSLDRLTARLLTGIGDVLRRKTRSRHRPGRYRHRHGGRAGGLLPAHSGRPCRSGAALDMRSEEHTSELQSLMRISYAVFCLKKKKQFTFTLCCELNLKIINTTMILPSNLLTPKVST